jgi:hypothetical protein
MGKPDSSGFDIRTVKLLRHALHQDFQVERVHTKDTFDVGLWKALLGAAHDPETEVAKWLESGCPTGIGDSVITGCGVFPRAEGSSATAEAAKIFVMMRGARTGSPSGTATTSCSTSTRA